MAANAFSTRSLNRISIVSTLVDGAMALRRGEPRRAAVLFGAAAVGSRVPGFGTAASVLLRIYRRLR